MNPVVVKEKVIIEQAVHSVQHRFQNITRQAAPKVYLHCWHFHLPKHYLLSEASKGLVLFPIAIFLLNSLAACNRVSGYVAHCMNPISSNEKFRRASRSLASLADPNRQETEYHLTGYHRSTPPRNFPSP